MKILHNLHCDAKLDTFIQLYSLTNSQIGYIIHDTKKIYTVIVKQGNINDQISGELKPSKYLDCTHLMNPKRAVKVALEKNEVCDSNNKKYRK